MPEIVQNNTIDTRIALKHDTEANWRQIESTFVPLQGELIIYEVDLTHSAPRAKVGDGRSTLGALSFIDAGSLNGEEEFVVKYENFQAFPNLGSPNKLYISLETNKIYHYTTAAGYVCLSEFSLNVTRQLIPKILEWWPGAMTTLKVEDNTLKITNGVAPQLNKENMYVVTNVTVGGAQ